MILRRSLLGSGGWQQRFLAQRCFTAGFQARSVTIEAGTVDGVAVGHDDPIEASAEKVAVAPSIPAALHSTSAAADIMAVETYLIRRQQGALLGQLGSRRSPFYQPHTLVTNPPSPSEVTLELLLASEAHQGHKTSLWNPSNARYILGIRQGIHIISLEATAAHLRRAAKIVADVTRRAGIVLFVGTRSGQDRCVVKAAELSGGYHVFERWIPGSITNAETILGSCKLSAVDEFDNEILGLEDQLQEHACVRPDLVICLNPLENTVLLHECRQNNIPSIGIIDTDADPSFVTYPIPANDDSLRCVQVIAGVLGRAGEEGRKARLEAAANGKITYTPTGNLEVPNKEEADKKAKSAS